MAEPQPVPNDLAGAYQAHRDQLAQASAADELLQRVRSRVNPQPEALPGESGTPVAPATAPQGVPPAYRTAGKVAKDIAVGVIESPRAVYTGARDALINTYNAVDDFSKWAGDKLSRATGFYGVRVGGPSGTHLLSEAEYNASHGPTTLSDLITGNHGDGVPQLRDLAREAVDERHVADPTTVTGGLIKGVSQFLTGLALVKRPLGALGLPTQAAGAGGYALSALKGAGANFIAFDPHQQRLSNLIERFPQLSNPVTQYLQSKPDDNAAEGRFKNALEGLGLGVLADGFFKGVKLLRGTANAKQALEGVQGMATEPAAPGIDEQAFQGLGDETAPANSSILRRQTTAEGGASAPAASLESRFGEQLKGDYQGSKDAYAAIPESQGGKVLNTDIARELSPEYSASLDSRSALAADVHEPASAFVKKMYAEKLAEAPAAGQDNTVLFTAGGTGAGKSTAIANIPEVQAVADRAQIVYDTNLNNFDSSKAKIDQALEAGKDVHIAYVYRDPVESMRLGALARAETKGRTVPVQDHLDTHTQSFDTVLKLQEAYKDDPDVHIDIIDNTGGKGQATRSSMEELAAKRYTSSTEELRNVVEQEYQAGNISDRVRQGTLGPQAQEPAGAGATERVSQLDRPVAGGQPEPQRAQGAQPEGLSPEQLSAAARGTGTAAPPKTFINFARINAPEDIERAIQELADAQHGEVSAAQRGVQTFEQTKLNASQLNAWDVLKSRRMGAPLNAEQSVAARELWASSAAKLTNLAEAAVTSPNEANLFAFRKMLSVHNAIQQEVLGARTETARALSSWRIPVGTPESRLLDVATQLQELGGGAGNVRDMAISVAKLARSGMDNELEAFVQKSAYAKTRDALIQAWTDALLTNPVTQAKILASNASTSLWRMGERGLAAKFSQFLDTPNGVAPGEMAAQWQGFIGGFRDAAAYGWKAAKTGVTGAGIGEPHEPLPSYISSAATGLDPDSWMGRAMDFMGTALSLPRRGIAAQHDMAQTLAYRMELNAQAVRQATSEMNAGGIAEDAFGDRVAELIANPPENINMAAVKGAKYQSFLDEPGVLAQNLLKIRSQVPAVRIILPFIKIPARIFSYAFERTPLAPLMSDFQANIAAGGARRDLALAQTALGTAVMLSAADMTMSGRLKGQGPAEKGLYQAQVREGERDWSVLVGDKWMDLNGIHPIGKLFTLAASTTEAFMNAQHELMDDTDTEKLAVATTLAISANVANTSYTQGLANFFAMLHDSRSGGAGETAILSTVGSAVPAVVAAAARADDPYQRAVYGMLDEFKSRIPGLSKSLPPSRDLWGEPVRSRNGAIESLISPVQTRDVKHSAIDDEILKQGFNITTPTRVQSFGSSPSARIDMAKYPAAFSRFMELAGHELKSPAWGVGAKELLNQIVSGKHPLSQVYQIKSDGPDGGKEVMIRDLLNQYREMAKRQVMQEYPALKADVEAKQEQQRQLKMPVLQ